MWKNLVAVGLSVVVAGCSTAEDFSVDAGFPVCDQAYLDQALPSAPPIWRPAPGFTCECMQYDFSNATGWRFECQGPWTWSAQHATDGGN
jgi:hypothetical protein